MPLTQVPSVTLLTGDRPVIYRALLLQSWGSHRRPLATVSTINSLCPLPPTWAFFPLSGCRRGRAQSPHTQVYTEHLLLTGPARPVPREPEGRGHPLPASPRLRARPGAYTGVGGRESQRFSASIPRHKCTPLSWSPRTLTPGAHPSLSEPTPSFPNLFPGVQRRRKRRRGYSRTRAEAAQTPLPRAPRGKTERFKTTFPIDLRVHCGGHSLGVYVF